MRTDIPESRRQRERQARRQLVLDRARRLFAKEGPENASMEDIATAADYTRRTLYSYFKSADEIRLLVATEDLRTRWVLQQQRIADVDTGLAKLIAWAEALYDFSKANPQAAQLQAYWDYRGLDRKHVSRESFKAFVEINDELADGLRAIFQLGIQDESMRSDLQVDMSISQFLHSLRSVIHRALSSTYSFASFDPDEYVQHFLDLFSRAIRNPEGQS